MVWQGYWAERGMKTHIARFHNVYGPNGTWDGGREKAPAALCRKVIEAIDKQDMNITIWGDGTPTRSFMYIDDCVKGIDMIMHCDELIATPINLGSHELVSITNLLAKVEKIAGVKLTALRPGRAPRRGGPQQRQHVYQKNAQVGAENAAGRGSGHHLPVDQGAIPQPQKGQTRR